MYIFIKISNKAHKTLRLTFWSFNNMFLSFNNSVHSQITWDTAVGNQKCRSHNYFRINSM